MKKEEIIVKAKTVDEAIQEICEKTNILREDITFEIIEEPKKSFLGLKNTPAVVKGIYELPKELKTKETLKELLENMGAQNFTLYTEKTDLGLKIRIEGDSLGFIIGRKGEVLDALQYILSLIVNDRKDETYYRIILDCNNYRAERQKDLEDLAKKMAESVKKNRKPVTMEPMFSYDRRVVHTIVQDIPGVVSSSVGVEPRRCVIIKPQ